MQRFRCNQKFRVKLRQAKFPRKIQKKRRTRENFQPKIERIIYRTQTNNQKFSRTSLSKGKRWRVFFQPLFLLYKTFLPQVSKVKSLKYGSPHLKERCFDLKKKKKGIKGNCCNQQFVFKESIRLFIIKKNNFS